MVGGDFCSLSPMLLSQSGRARAGLGEWERGGSVEVRHLEMQTCCDKVSGPLGAPNPFLPG